MDPFDPRPLAQMLRRATEPVAFWFRHEILGPRHPEVVAGRPALAAAPLRRETERQQRHEGHWGTHLHPETGEPEVDSLRLYTNLRLLADYGATAGDEPVAHALEALWSLQIVDGRFPLYWHHMGHLLVTLARLGQAGDQRVQRLDALLRREQRADGGWLNPLYEPRVTVQGGPSCVWTTVNVVLGLLAGAQAGPDPVLERAAGFLEATILTPGYRSFCYGGMEPWQTLHYGYRGIRFFVGPHLVLDALSCLGATRYGEPLARLWVATMAQRRPDGWWGDAWTTLTIWRVAARLHSHD
ncbi:MAG: hypothetical protein M5U01_23230 [Ardenticatenaceae bacterium]|nr:hypothetical protein [Ardenticatenaceae bacterium]